MISAQTPITKNRHMARISTFSKEYVVEMEVMVTKVPTGGNAYNIIHLTADTRTTDYGRYILAIWFRFQDGMTTIIVRSAVNGNKSYKKKIPYKEFDLSKWIMIKVSQTKAGNKYKYTVEIDGKTITDDINTKPQEFQNVKLYVSNPWASSLPGYIRKLFIKGKIHSLFFMKTYFVRTFSLRIPQKRKHILRGYGERSLVG